MSRAVERHPGGRDRAPRFQMQLPLHYRCPGQQQWHAARTLNVSRSGVLFQVLEALEGHLGEALAQGAGLELRLTLKMPDAESRRRPCRR
jgi:hypothetical protein